MKTSEFAARATALLGYPIRPKTVYRWLKEGRIQASLRGFKFLEFDESELAKLNAPRVVGARRAKPPAPVSTKGTVAALEAVIDGKDVIEPASDEPLPTQDRPPEITHSMPLKDVNDYKESLLKAATDKFGGRMALALRLAWREEEDDAVRFCIQLMPGLKPSHMVDLVKMTDVETAKRRVSIWLPKVLGNYSIPEE